MRKILTLGAALLAALGCKKETTKYVVLEEPPHIHASYLGCSADGSTVFAQDTSFESDGDVLSISLSGSSVLLPAAGVSRSLESVVDSAVVLSEFSVADDEYDVVVCKDGVVFDTATPGKNEFVVDVRNGKVFIETYQFSNGVRKAMSYDLASGAYVDVLPSEVFSAVNKDVGSKLWISNDDTASSPNFRLYSLDKQSGVVSTLLNGVISDIDDVFINESNENIISYRRSDGSIVFRRVDGVEFVVSPEDGEALDIGGVSSDGSFGSVVGYGWLGGFYTHVDLLTGVSQTLDVSSEEWNPQGGVERCVVSGNKSVIWGGPFIEGDQQFRFYDSATNSLDDLLSGVVSGYVEDSDIAKKFGDNALLHVNADKRSMLYFNGSSVVDLFPDYNYTSVTAESSDGRHVLINAYSPTDVVYLVDMSTGTSKFVGDWGRDHYVSNDGSKVAITYGWDVDKSLTLYDLVAGTSVEITGNDVEFKGFSADNSKAFYSKNSKLYSAGASGEEFVCYD